MSDLEKAAMEEAQSDGGLADYGEIFEYEAFADRIKHFKRIQQR